MRRLGIVAVGLPLVVGILVAGMRFARLTEPAEAQAPPNVVSADSACIIQGYGPQDVAFFFGSHTKWDAAWIDLSLQHNGFAPGTFLSAGPFPPEYMASAVPDRVYNNLYVWRGLTPGLTHYFRVNLLYGDQWYPSPTQTFYVPFVCAPTPAPSPASALPSASLPADDLEGRVRDLEDQVYDLQRELSDVESRLDSLVRCLNSNTDELTSPGTPMLSHCR
jgi:hypothetical protein